MTTLARWNPFLRDMGFSTRLSRWLENPREDFEFSTPWVPPVDIYEDGDNNIVLNVELPGVDPKNVELTLEQNVLTIRGERRFDREVEEESYHRRELAYGTFSRSFTLPALVDRDKVSAAYKDGVLKVVVPRKAEARPRQIEVKAA